MIVPTAKARPESLDSRSLTVDPQLADHLRTKAGPKVNVGRERLRQILIAEGITL